MPNKGHQTSHGLSRLSCSSKSGPWTHSLCVSISRELVTNVTSQALPRRRYTGNGVGAGVGLHAPKLGGSPVAPRLHPWGARPHWPRVVLQLPKALSYVTRSEHLKCHMKSRILKSENWVLRTVLLIMSYTTQLPLNLCSSFCWKGGSGDLRRSFLKQEALFPASCGHPVNGCSHPASWQPHSPPDSVDLLGAHGRRAGTWALLTWGL